MQEVVTATMGSLSPANGYLAMLLDPELNDIGLNETLMLVTSGILYGPALGPANDIKKLLKVLAKISQRLLCIGERFTEDGFDTVRSMVRTLGYLSLCSAFSCLRAAYNCVMPF